MPSNLVSLLLHDLVTDPVAGFTAILATFTGLLAISTVGLWWATLTAARLSKRGLESLERPIVFGGVDSSGLSESEGTLFSGRLSLVIYNHGRTPARLRRIEWGIHLAPTGGIAPPIDPLEIGGRALPAGTICVPGDPYEEVENLFGRFSLVDSKQMLLGHQAVWVLGFVRFEDVFSQHHLSGFALAYDPIGRRFVRRGGDRYNYERIEKARDIPAPRS